VRGGVRGGVRVRQKDAVGDAWKLASAAMRGVVGLYLLRLAKRLLA
jgi:hypothetical protein